MIVDINNNVITDPDLSAGYLVSDTMTVHHAAVAAVAEQGHYETIAEYPNGGKDVRWVIDTPGVAGHDAYDEQVPVQRYIPYTAEELAALEAAQSAPSELERLEAQLFYTAMMTDTLLEEV